LSLEVASFVGESSAMAVRIIPFNAAADADAWIAKSRREMGIEFTQLSLDSTNIWDRKRLEYHQSSHLAGLTVKLISVMHKSDF